jgi:hypothetical protein
MLKIGNITKLKSQIGSKRWRTQDMGVQTFDGKVPDPLLYADSLTAHE